VSGAASNPTRVVVSQLRWAAKACPPTTPATPQKTQRAGTAPASTGRPKRKARSATNAAGASHTGGFAQRAQPSPGMRRRGRHQARPFRGRRRLEAHEKGVLVQKRREASLEVRRRAPLRGSARAELSADIRHNLFFLRGEMHLRSCPEGAGTSRGGADRLRDGAHQCCGDGAHDGHHRFRPR
jgi:hypothetical protein